MNKIVAEPEGVGITGMGKDRDYIIQFSTRLRTGHLDPAHYASDSLLCPAQQTFAVDGIRPTFLILSTLLTFVF